MSDLTTFPVCFSSDIRDASCSGVTCLRSPHLGYPSFRDNVSLFTWGIKKYPLAHRNIPIFLVPMLVFLSEGKGERKTEVPLFLSHLLQLKKETRSGRIVGIDMHSVSSRAPLAFLMCFISFLSLNSCLVTWLPMEVNLTTILEYSVLTL